MTLSELNQLDTQAAYEWFEQTCATQNWCNAMVAQRPYDSLQTLKETALDVWQTMQETDFLQAFEAHPMIGDVNSLKKKFANTQGMASKEQEQTAQASEETLQALHDLNHEYANKNGFIFIICATGLSADTMLSALKQRIHNSREEEIHNAAQEQIKITLLRLEKNL